MSKEDDIDLEDFDLDDDLDFSSDFDPPQNVVSDDRNAVTTVAASAGKGAVNAIVGPGKRRSLIVNSLPNDYKVAIGSYDTLANGGKEVLRDAKLQLSETKRELQRAAREAAPAFKKYLPASLTKRIDRFAKDDSKTGNYEDVDPREAAIKASLTDTFGGQASYADQVADQKDRLQARVEGELEKSANLKRQDNMFDMVAGIRGEIAKQSAHLVGPGESYRRKILEIGYRQLYAMTDIHSTLKTAFEKLLPNSDGILKNTALPDYAKEEFGEITSALMKRELVKAASPGEFARDYISQLSGNIKNAISESLSGFTETISMIASVAGSSAEFDDGPELSPEQQRKQVLKTGANIAGGMFAEKYVSPHIKKAQGYIRDKLESNEEVMSLGRRARYQAGTVVEGLNDLSKDPSRYGGGASEMIGNILQTVLPSYGGDTASLTGNTAEALGSPTPFTKKDNIALTDVIPTLLSTINSSVLSLRGITSDVMQFDYESSKFESEKNIQDRIREDVGDNATREWAMRAIDDIVKSLDDGNELSDDSKSDLGRVIDDRIRKVGRFNVNDLSQNYEAYADSNVRDPDALMDFFEKMKEDKVKTETMNYKVSEDIQRVRSGIRPVQERVDEMSKRYGNRALVGADVFKSNNGNVSLNRDILNSETNFGKRTLSAKDEIETVVSSFVDVIREDTKAKSATGNVRKGSSADSLSSAAISMSEDVYSGVRRAMFGEEKPNLQTLLQAAAKAPIGEEKEQLSGLVAHIHEQLIANNLTAQVDSILQILNELAISGIPIAGEGTGEGIKARASYFGKFGAHVSKSAGKVKDGLNSGVQFIAKGVKGFRDSINKLIPDKLGAIKSLYDGGISGLRSFRDAAMGLTSIYDADGNVILHGRLLKAGKYFDADGKVIKSIKDIVGAVYDADGNVVITMDDIKDKLSGLSYYAKDGWKRFSEMVGKKAGSLTNSVLGIPKIVTDKLKSAGDFLKRNLMASPDIYVKGETSPRIRQMLLRKGYYVNQKTGKPILGAHDISGPIVTQDGIMVISAEELADPNFQLVDIEGKPFKTTFEKVVDFAVRAKNRLIKDGKRVLDAAKNAGGMVLDKMGAAKDYVKGKFGGGGVNAKGAVSIVDKLTEIYSLLDDRLPGGSGPKPKPDITDNDGDGDRDGSFTDLFDIRKKRREAKEKDKKEAKAKGGKDVGDDDKTGFLSGLMGKLGGMLTGIGTTVGGLMATVFGKKALSLLGDGLGSILTKLNPFSAGGMFRTAAGAVTTGAATTVGGAATGAGAATAAGAAGGAAAATSKRAAMRSMVVKAATTVGRSAAWQGLRMGAAALLGVLSAPVVLAVGAVAGLGYLAYRAMTRNDPLYKLRMAQYGTEDYADSKSDEVAKLAYLEESLMKFTSWDGNSISRIKGIKNEHIYTMANELGVETENTQKVELFEQWLFGRFIPVFLLWTTRARQYAPGIEMKDLGDDNKVDPKVMLKILQGVVLEPGHPVFKVMHSPFSDRGWGDTIGGWFGGDDMMSAESVAEVAKESEEDILDMTPWKKDDKRAAEQKVITNASTATVLSKATQSANKANVPSDRLKQQTPGLGILTTDNLPSGALTPKKPDAGRGSINMSATLAGMKDPTQKSRVDSNVNALEAIRLKAYGVIELTIDKVALLWDLEAYVLKDIKVTSNNADVRVDMSEATSKYLTQFGLQMDNPEHVTRWQAWFERRFLTVFVRYLMKLKLYSPSADPLYLRVSGNTPFVKNIASAIITTETLYEGKRVSIWTLTHSPFSDGSIGTSPSITEDNVRFLEDMIGGLKVLEQTKVKLSNILPPASIARPKAKKEARKDNGTSMNDLVDAQYAEMMKGGGGESVFNPGAGSGFPVGEFKDSQVDANGSYAKIRLRTNDPAAVAEMLKEVSKLTGVDQNLLLTFAMMESSLNPKAGAGTSSAKGLFQFLDGTWGDVMNKHANKYGIPSNASAYDPVANAILGAEYIKGGAKEIGKLAPSGKPEAADLYLAHFMGHGGVKKFLKGLNTDPNRIAALDFKGPAGANPGVFMGPKGALSYGDMYEKIRRKARTNFSYVAKYSDNPIFESTKPVVKGADTAAASRPKMPSIGESFSSPVSESRMSDVTVAKARNDVSTAMANSGINESVSMTPNVSTQQSDVMNSAAMSSKTEEVSNNTPLNKQEIIAEYRRAAEEQLAAKTPRKVQQSGFEGVIANGTRHSEQNDEMLKVMLGQLELQTSMEVSLRQMNEKMATLVPSTRESGQMLRDHGRSPAPEVTHKPGPISVGRVRQ